ncbi:helix-turn-helix domain-containing protein [Paratractidigestivibacter sp.]|uniref:helix-turn-helix domain-containing protein n=1 Tax=Paratractidigestivibacter sp. TaxID=2847316 RepID=UPI002ACB09B4|nr:helix-turn-helix domain-containing protein [Paratractidigestivibacter sp.]
MPACALTMPTRPLHSKEAAEWLGISTKSLLEFARAGLIGKKVGGVWFFSMKALCEFAGVPYEPQNPSRL